MKYERDNGVMVSFDVESLFTNVPIQDVVQVVLRNLVNDRGLPDHTNLCECGKVCIGKQGERLAGTQISAISETGGIQLPIWDKVKAIDRDFHWCTRRVKEAIHI